MLPRPYEAAKPGSARAFHLLPFAPLAVANSEQARTGQSRAGRACEGRTLRRARLRRCLRLATARVRSVHACSRRLWIVLVACVAAIFDSTVRTS
jgi:hypothetical protein